MKNIFLSLMLFSCLYANSQGSQHFETSAFGITPNYIVLKNNQLSGDLHFNTIRNYGGNFFYKYSYYMNKKNEIGIGLNYGYNRFLDTIFVSSSKYNLQFNYWNSINYDVSNLSVYIDYTKNFIISDKNLVFMSLKTGLNSSFAPNKSMTYGIIGYENFIEANHSNYIKPSPVFGFDLGFKRELRNNNFLNFNLTFQYSSKTKYLVDYVFFKDIPEFYSQSIISTSLSYFGFSFSYEFRHKN